MPFVRTGLNVPVQALKPDSHNQLSLNTMHLKSTATKRKRVPAKKQAAGNATQTAVMECMLLTVNHARADILKDASAKVGGCPRFVLPRKMLINRF